MRTRKACYYIKSIMHYFERLTIAFFLHRTGSKRLIAEEKAAAYLQAAAPRPDSAA